MKYDFQSTNPLYWQFLVERYSQTPLIIGNSGLHCNKQNEMQNLLDEDLIKNKEIRM